ncbi:hypothetical protein GTQ40_07945 [Flavobacteriaceae bacterium R38]|nr:hypothetical protein [Flavobacteriaceae bacterium R38]
MLLKKLKEISAQKALKKALNQENSYSKTGNEKIKSFACILNVDEFNHMEVFEELAKEIGLRQDQFKIVGFSALNTDMSNYSIPVFSAKDIGWNGTIENGDINEFLSKEYDLLLNYYETPSLALSLVSISTKAKLRVGIHQNNEIYNDIILKVKASEYLKFKPELIKYLSILNRI